MIQLAHDPPMVGLSFSIFQGIGKNTRDNILATQTFTVNIISEPFLDAANACSIDAPPEVDEWLISGLTPEPSVSPITLLGSFQKLSDHYIKRHL